VVPNPWVGGYGSIGPSSINLLVFDSVDWIGWIGFKQTPTNHTTLEPYNHTTKQQTVKMFTLDFPTISVGDKVWRELNSNFLIINLVWLLWAPILEGCNRFMLLLTPQHEPEDVGVICVLCGMCFVWYVFCVVCVLCVCVLVCLCVCVCVCAVSTE
jgi:hypothetical protein